jgi:hypothetical protein
VVAAIIAVPGAPGFSRIASLRDESLRSARERNVEEDAEVPAR